MDLEHLPFPDLSNFKFHFHLFHSFFNQHLVLYFFLPHPHSLAVFKTGHWIVTQAHLYQLGVVTDGYSLSQATELHFRRPAVESHPVQLPYRWPSTGARSPRHPGWVRWRLGRSSFIMESYNDVLPQCHLSFILLYHYTLYIRVHDERRMLMSCCLLTFTLVGFT